MRNFINIVTESDDFEADYASFQKIQKIKETVANRFKQLDISIERVTCDDDGKVYVLLEEQYDYSIEQLAAIGLGKNHRISVYNGNQLEITFQLDLSAA